jgi:hypothetical protein
MNIFAILYMPFMGVKSKPRSQGPVEPRHPVPTTRLLLGH